MKIRRKTNRCLNCGHTLSELYHFCPYCGQENNDINISFGTFVGEFFSNYFSFDSRIGRSMKPLFLRPGFLTNRFNEGQRMRYVHPLRLYLIASVFFFFVATLWIQKNLENVSIAQTEALSTYEAENDSLESPAVWKRILPLMRNPALSDKIVLDSLERMGVMEKTLGNDVDSSAVANKLFRQLRKVASNDLSVFGGYIMQNLPIMMFIVLPLLAFMIKLFYIRSNPLYVHHLIHVLHLQAFAFLVYSLYLLVIVLFDGTDTVPDWVDNTVLLVIVAYSFLSFLHIYGQSWYKTLLKFFLLGNIYFLLILLATLLEGLISFWIF